MSTFSRHDDDTRTVTIYDEAGTVTSTRPYTAEENAAADAGQLAELFAVNERSIFDKMQAALDSNNIYLNRSSPTNAQNLEQIRRMTRQLNGLLRITGRLLTDVADT